MDLIEKRSAVLVRSYRSRRLNLVDVLGWAAELGLCSEEVVQLAERCAGVAGPGDRVRRLKAMLVREYAARRLYIDEVIALAAELGFEQRDVDDLIDDCGGADLAA
jgi:hypothetical protein